MKHTRTFRAAILATLAVIPTHAALAQSFATTPFQGNFEDVARALSDRVSVKLNVKAFGAKGDGSTDDTAAFQHIAAVATGNIPSGISSTLSSYLSSLPGFSGVGPRSNSAIEIDIPAGHYVLSAPIAINYQPNTAIRWHGDGSSMTELEFRGGIDGLVTTFNSNSSGSGNDVSRMGAWPGQGIEVDGIHFIANTGIVAAAASGRSNIGNGQGEAGTAIKTIGLQLINASMPPFQIYHDILFSNSGGWNDAANNWKGALYLQDPDNLFIDRVAFIDHSLDTNRTSVPIWIHSTAPAGGPGHGNLNLDYPLILGGITGIQIDGNAFQGINISHGATIGVQDGITWLAAANSLSGSITISDGSYGAARHMVNMTNVSTIFSHDNFYYNVKPPTGTNPIFFQVGGGDTLVSHHDQFYGPTAGYEGTGYTSTAMFITGFGSADVAPSHISDDTVSHFDSGIIYGGGSTMNFTNDVVSSDTTTCYRDTSTATASNLRGQFDGIYCGAIVNMHDGVGLASGYDWLPARYINGGIEIGMPGVTSPAGTPGYAGGIDFHSLTSRDGTVGGLNDYDARLAAVGGTSGTSGAGELDLYGSFVLKSGRLTASAGTTLAGSDLTVTAPASFQNGVTMGSNTRWSAGAFPVLASTLFKNLPSNCGAGGLAYVQDGRKPGEAAGVGSGVLAICTPAGHGLPTAWVSSFSGSAVAN